MLALTRRVNERIVIDKRIVINVARINGGHVSISIAAPADVEIDREEVFKKKYPMHNLLRGLSK